MVGPVKAVCKAELRTDTAGSGPDGAAEDGVTADDAAAEAVAGAPEADVGTAGMTTGIRVVMRETPADVSFEHGKISALDSL